MKAMRVVLSGLLCAGSYLAATTANAVESFYKGATVSINVGSDAGGGFDLVARVVARHLGQHIPGKPAIIVRNMPGAGGLVNANWLYNSAPRDGTAIAAPFNTVFVLPLLGDPAAKFDPREFTWIGSTDKQQGVCLTWHKSPVKTLDDLKTREVVAGTTAPNATPGTFPFLMNSVLGTRFKIVGGYSTGGVRLAFEQGEVDSICGMAIQTHMAVSPQWFEKKLVNVLLQFGLEKHKDLPDVPLAVDLLKDEDLEVLELILIPHEFGRPFVAPPKIPADRRNALRAAFEAVLKDPAFLDDSAKAKQSLDPISASQIEELLQRAYKASPAAIQRAARILRGPESVDQKR
ncbi:MAG: Bug family tripartite tricarboxylate transporter substrate binding protein [Beijerinckiaceae bacterium]